MESVSGASAVFGKMKSDVTLMESELKAKQSILAEVLGGLDEMKSASNRQFVKKIFKANTTTSPFAPSSFEVVKLGETFGLGENVVAVFRISNKSRCPLSCDVHILAPSCSSVTSTFLNKKSKTITSVSANSSAKCVVSFEIQLISENKVNLVFSPRWLYPPQGISPVLCRLLSSDSELPKSELVAITVEEPVVWHSLADFPTLDEAEAKRVIEGCSVSLASRQFKPLSISSFRSLYGDHFQCCDFGEWQVFVGTNKYSGLLVTSTYQDCGSVNIAYFRDNNFMERFVKSLDGI